MIQKLKTQKIQLSLNAGIALCYMIYGYFCAVLFYRQSVELNGKYFSDLPVHISYGVNHQGYSLMEAILGVIVRDIGSYKLVGIFLALVVMASIFLTWLFMRKLAPDVNPVILHLAAFAVNMVMAFYLPYFNDYRYLGVQSGNIYHNSTYTGMKMLGMLVLFLYMTCQEIYEQGLGPVRWFSFAASLILVNMVKPNFFVAFAPAMGMVLLYDLIRKKGTTLLPIIRFGLAVIPSVVVLFYSYMMLFPGGDSHIIIDPGYCFFLRTRTPLMAILQTLAFPLWILAFHWKDLKDNRKYGFSWLFLLISFLEYFFLAESGVRKNDGNLSWGYCFGIYVIFAASAAVFCRDLKERKKPLVYYVVASALFLGHMVFWFQYFHILFIGKIYS